MDNFEISQESIQKRKRSDKLQGRQFEKLRDHFLGLLRKSPMLYKTVRDALRTGDQFIAQIPKEISKKLQNGELELVKNGETGLFNGMIRKADGNREIVKQVNWKKVNISNEMIENIHQLTLQAQLDEISQQLQEISRAVNEVLKGQHNDRIAEVKAGLDQYKAALNAKSDKNRDFLLKDALSKIVEGRNKLMRNIDGFFSLKKREPGFWDEYWWKTVVRIDKPETDLHRAVNEEKEKLTESLQAICLAFAYEMKIAGLLEEEGIAQIKREEFIEFVENHLSIKSILMQHLPPEIERKIKESATSLGKLTTDIEIGQGLEILISKEELENEKM